MYYAVIAVHCEPGGNGNEMVTPPPQIIIGALSSEVV